MTPPRYSLAALARQLRVDVELLLALAGDPSAHYRPFTVSRRGKKPRDIDNPDDALKWVQRRIRMEFLAPLPLPEHVHGCVKGRSQLSNAQTHLGQANVASVDVKSFYPSITNAAIYRLWRRLGFGAPLASLLTKLTTRGGHLPQGAPTSDALANHAVDAVDAQIAVVAQRLGLRLSRYLDNIDLSGDLAREAIAPVIAALREQGLPVRHEKVFNAGRAARQTVTGYTVNNRNQPSVCRNEQRRIRSAVHEIIRSREAGHATLAMERSLRGRLAFLRRTNVGAAERLDRQLVQVGIVLR